MKTSRDEAKEIGIYNMVLENNDFESAVKQMEAFLTGQKTNVKAFDIDRFISEVDEIIKSNS